MSAKTSTIEITISLDENHVPESIQWSASDMPTAAKMSNAMLLSMWDTAEKNTMFLPLWTKDMLVDDMKQFYFQQLMMMTESFEKATNDATMGATMRDFANYFGEKMGILTPNTTPTNGGE